MQNYFNYFTEIEDRFQQRRGSLLMLSTLDWALIETWREAGLPLEIVLRGIDDAFDHYDAKLARAQTRAQTRGRRINGLAWCAQAVMVSAQRAAEASLASPTDSAPTPAEKPETGFEHARICAFLRANADTVAAAILPPPADTVAAEVATRLHALALELEAVTPANPLTPTQPRSALNLEALDRSLTILEEKLLAGVLTATPEDQLTALREQAARELAPYRGKMQAVQIRQVQQQFLGKRLLATHRLPRLSLFYMGLA